MKTKRGRCVKSQSTNVRASSEFEKHKNIALLIGIVVLFNLFYGNYTQSPFAADTYAVYYHDRIEDFRFHLTNGRLILAVVVLFINFARHRFLSYILECMFTSAAVFVLLKNSLKDVTGFPI